MRYDEPVARLPCGEDWKRWDGTCVRDCCPNHAARREIVCIDHLPKPFKDVRFAKHGTKAMRARLA